MPRQHIPLPNSYNCIVRMGRSVLWLLVAVSAALCREAQAEFVDDFNIPVTVLVPEGKENDTLRLHLAAYGAPPYGELMDKCGPDSVRLKVLPTVAAHGAVHQLRRVVRASWSAAQCFQHVMYCCRCRSVRAYLHWSLFHGTS